MSTPRNLCLKGALPKVEPAHIHYCYGHSVFWTPYLAPHHLLEHHLLPLPCFSIIIHSEERTTLPEKGTPTAMHAASGSAALHFRGLSPSFFFGAAASASAAAGCVKSIRSIARPAGGLQRRIGREIAVNLVLLRCCPVGVVSSSSSSPSPLHLFGTDR